METGHGWGDEDLLARRTTGANHEEGEGEREEEEEEDRRETTTKEAGKEGAGGMDEGTAKDEGEVMERMSEERRTTPKPSAPSRCQASKNKRLT